MEPDDIFSELYPAYPKISVLPAKMPLGMAYVPMQEFRELYSPEEGFKRGTLFRELDFPWHGSEGVTKDG